MGVSRTDVICAILVVAMLLLAMWMIIPDDMPDCVRGTRQLCRIELR